jgi:TPR repeat protein
MERSNTMIDITVLEKKASKGDAQAALELARAFDSPKYREIRDLDRARYYLQLAADLHHPEALWTIGKNFMDCDEDARDPEQAMRFLRAAAHKEPKYRAELAMLLSYKSRLGPADHVASTALLQSAFIETGASVYAMELAKRYFSGKGIQRNLTRALALYLYSGNMDFADKLAVEVGPEDVFQARRFAQELKKDRTLLANTAEKSNQS